MKKRLGEMLIEAGVIDATQLQAALGHQRRWGGRVGQALVHLNLASEEDVVAALARKFGFQPARLDALEPYALNQALSLVPREFALRNHLFPVAADTSTITVAMSDPTNVSLADELRFRTGRRVLVRIAGEIAIAEALKKHYPGPQGLAAVEAIALDPDGGDDPIDPVLDPFGGGSSDELEAFFSTQVQRTPAPPAFDVPAPAVPASRARPRPGAAIDLEDVHTPDAIPLDAALDADLGAVPEDGLGEADPALLPLEELPLDALEEELTGDALEPAWPAGPDGAGDAEPGAPSDPTLELYAPPGAGHDTGFEDDPARLTDEEFAILDALDRMASGALEEPTVVKPAQLAAAAVRLLIRKGIITDQELLDELLKK